MSAPKAVLLDAGGIFLLPEHERILGAFERAEHTVGAEILDEAHYRAAARFTTDLDVDADWAGCWRGYLEAYIDACGIDACGIDACGAPIEDRDEVHRHLDSEFADAALWIRIAPGSVDGLRALADRGVQLGVVSNADGVMGERLRLLEILQVGPGLGVEVACVIDSGAVGIMKPDPRIFRLALDVLGLEPEAVWYVGDMPAIDVVGARRAGIRPFVMDPLGLHCTADYDRVASLTDLAARVDAA